MDHRTNRNFFSGPLIRTIWHCVACLAIAGTGAQAGAEELIADFKGFGNEVTDEFEITGPWLLDWHVTSDYADSLGIDISLVDAVFLSHKGVVLATRRPGSGTKLFHESGRFRFRIIASTTNWRLRVSKISEEEASRMKPVER